MSQAEATDSGIAALTVHGIAALTGISADRLRKAIKSRPEVARLFCPVGRMKLLPLERLGQLRGFMETKTPPSSSG